MALHKGLEKYHEMGPQQVFKKDEESVAHFDIARTTSQSGEQLHITCPVYKTDTREELNERLQFCYSVIQDRLEDENKAVVELNEKAQKERALREGLGRNKKKYEADLKELKRAAKKEGWDYEKLKAAEEELTARFELAQKTFEENGVNLALKETPLEEEPQPATH